MRIIRAIDAYLEQMRVEQDWTPRTVHSYYECLAKLAAWLEAHGNADPRLSDLNGRAGTEQIRRFIGETYGRTASSTRATRISYLHSFFAWAEEEGHIDDDPARRIKRPPKRRPDIYRPTQSEIDLVLMAATTRELAPLLLMSGAGLRASELCDRIWSDVDLTRGRIRTKRKGGHWFYLPLDPLVLDRLRDLYRALEPEPDDYVFTAETEQWADQEHRVRRLIDPKTRRAPKTLWNMVQRVSKRAGVRALGPHQLRHGFANSFLHATRDRFGVADTETLQLLMGHSRIDTTQQYLRDLEAQDAENVLRRLRADDVSQSGEAEGHPLGWPSNRFMEAAGIEPASAPGEPSESGGTEPDEPRSSHKRRLTSERSHQKEDPNA